MTKPEYNLCENCNEEVTPDSDFCPHCGVLFQGAEKAACDTHADRAAAGVCIICRKLVCTECGVAKHQRTFCTEHKGIAVRQDWAQVFQSTDVNDAELAKSVLKSLGFKVMLQNFNSIGFVWDGGGDSSMSRSALSKPAMVFVPIPEYLEAARALTEWQSGRPQQEELDPDHT